MAFTSSIPAHHKYFCWLSVIGSTAVSKTAGIGSNPIASAKAGLAQTVEQLSYKQQVDGFKSCIRLQIGRWSNGRTMDFDSISAGSNPALPAI